MYFCVQKLSSYSCIDFMLELIVYLSVFLCNSQCTTLIWRRHCLQKLAHVLLVFNAYCCGVVNEHFCL